MATGFNRKIRRLQFPTRGGSSTRADSTDRTAPAAPLWRRRWAWILAGLLAAVGLAPSVLGHTSFRNQILAGLLASPQGSVTCHDASLGWFSPISAEHVELRDAQGELIASAPSVTLDKSLLGLLLDSTSLGAIRVEAPQLYVELREDGSNVEDFVAAFQSPDAEPTRVSFVLEVHDGAIHWEDRATGRTWQLNDVKTHLAMSTFEALPLRIKAAASLASQPAGTLQADLTLPMEAGSPDPTRIKLQADRFPLAFLQTIVCRYVPDTKLSGTLTTQLDLTWKAAGDVALAGDVLATDLRLQTPALGQDQIALDRLQMPCQVTYDGRRLKIDQLDAECDLGSLSVQGSVAAGAAAADLLQQPLQARGKLDLARLAQMLPETLNIRPGTKITSGEIELALDSRADGATHRWHGEITATRLAAESTTRKIVWEQPIEMLLDARQADGGEVVVDQFSCRSDFLQLAAEGTPARLTGQAHYNLNALVDHLAQVVDLHGWQISGAGDADFVWTRAADGDFDLAARLDTNFFQVSAPGRPPWVEEKMTVKLSAAGNLAQRTAREAALLIEAGDEDRLHVQLREPVREITSAAVWPLQARLQGQLARWLPRLQPILTPPDCRLQGACDLAADISLGGGQIAVEALKLTLQQFALDGYGLHIAEPKIELTAAGTFDAKEMRLDAPTLTLASSTLSLRGESLAAKLPADAPPVLSGTVALQGTLDRLQHWLDDPRHPFKYRVAGKVSGQVQLSRVAGETTAQFHLDGDDLQLTEQTAAAEDRPPAARPVWSEPELALDASASYREKTDHLDLHKLQLASNTLGLSAAGTVDQLTSRQLVDLSSTLNYDLAQVMPLLEPYLGAWLRLQGRDAAAFQIKGPLALAVAEPVEPWSRRLSGSVALGWKQGQLCGLDVGPAKLEARLGDGSVAFLPLRVPVAEGQLVGAPRVQFDPAPAAVLLPAGPLAEQVRVSPEVCDRALKYVAPVLAEATRTEGRFSMELEGGRVPLDAPAQADAAGKLSIHRVEVLPGPLARQFILLGKQIEALVHRRPPPLALEQNTQPLLTMENQDIDFRVVEGRVYHRGMTVRAGDVVVHTHGSVGFDQTLALVADVPIQDRWIGNDPVARSLSGKSIQVVINGTLQHPQLDRRSIEQLAAQMLRGAARDILTRELNEQLNRLFQSEPK